MLFHQIVKKRPEGVTLFLFRQDAGNIARNRICSSGADLPADSGELIFRQANGDLRRGHTNIIPVVSRPNKRPGRRPLEKLRKAGWFDRGDLLLPAVFANDFAIPYNAAGFPRDRETARPGPAPAIPKSRPGVALDFCGRPFPDR